MAEVDHCKWKFCFCHAFRNIIPQCDRCPFTEKQEKHELHIADEWKIYPGTMGSFHRALCEAITLADLKNTAKLRKAYPFLVRALTGRGTKYELEKEGA